MVKAVFDELSKSAPKNHFTVGIVDDVTHTSLTWDPDFDTEPDDVARAVFFGLGADGTVGANKNSIKIIGEETDNYAQGYFVYDSKKSGAVTISHLRFPKPIRSTYLVTKANFVACHQESFLEKYDVLETRGPGRRLPSERRRPARTRSGTHLPREVQEPILEKKLRFFVIDAYKVARELGMGGADQHDHADLLLRDLGRPAARGGDRRRSRRPIEKTYGKKGAEIVKKNFAAVDGTLEHLCRGEGPRRRSRRRGSARPIVSDAAPDFVKRVSAVMLAGKGDLLPVSAFPPDGTWPLSTATWEKRNIALDIPVWDEKLCIQCNKCAMVCPHAAIRVKVYDPARAREGPGDLQVDRLQGARVQGEEVHGPGRPGGLHGLHPLRGRLPGQGQVEPEAQVARHGARSARSARPRPRTSTSSSTSPRPRATRSGWT